MMINKCWLSFCALLVTGSCRAMLASRLERATLAEVADRCGEDQQNIHLLLHECSYNLVELPKQRGRVESAGSEFVRRYTCLISLYKKMTNALLRVQESSFSLEQDILDLDALGGTGGDTLQALLSNERGLAAEITLFLECSLSIAEMQRDFMYDVNNTFCE